MIAPSSHRDRPAPAPGPLGGHGDVGRELRVLAAPTWRRALALALDLLPLLTVWLVIALALFGAPAQADPAAHWNPLDQLVDFVNARPGTAALALLLLATLGFAWPFVAHLAWGRTPGKRVLGLAVVDARGARPSPARAAAWCALRVLGTALLLGGLLWALADPERRTLHDRLAGIWVIRAPT